MTSSHQDGDETFGMLPHRCLVQLQKSLERLQDQLAHLQEAALQPQCPGSLARYGPNCYVEAIKLC